MPSPSDLPSETAGAFDAFGFDPRIVHALGAIGFDAPTPIQAEAMPPLLEGRDVIGRARTGSGKTAAFGLPLLQRVVATARPDSDGVRALVLTPTRELALQVTKALRSFAEGLPIEMVTVYGGAAYGPQLKALRRGVPIVVGTPGRVLDHVERGTLDLSALELLVLDEADEMLRMGFFEDVERVFERAPDSRQVALFSATMPPPIQAVAENRLPDPIEVQVEDSALSVDHIEQRGILVPERHKLDALERLLAAEPLTGAIVFCRTRAGCAETADALAKRGLSVDALHGDLNQAARERVLMRFRAGRLQVVVATDVAARGIDVDTVSHVINYDLPPAPEEYVHRIGRTGRAGRDGVAISLVTPRERGRLRFFQKKLGVTIAKVDPPSDAAIARAERARLVARLAEHLDAPLPGVDELLGALPEGADARQIAAAALSLLAEKENVTLGGELDETPPRWASKAPRDRGPRDHGGSARFDAASGDELDLFLPVGKRRGVRPGDLVGALTGDAGIPGSTIGRVTILDHKSFVRIAREAAEHVLATSPQIQVRGRMVPVAKARPRSVPDRPRRPKGRGKPFRGPSRKPKGRRKGRG
ncbi:MAG TPA: DEAD/DEAH box helicase [Polyangiaceae bacterium LLY-WYZ-15_(1-7)]|nr:hypothetical protein [Myxococcales bacterium]MAT26772.1 hypothetical protein [Sandaracinus sp.]HJK89410.1 DEAD/DEAH box helicase [Polyangiaceae bacterium LLY-WYZ-15_(1-7)]MBJ72338.1 hypothetical protein [Sandaracinus sp.]HJK99905.1 DEAD/DEAH box helicase [Polyangiaceae bacterium LLY-WYZ-15_(1-7)]